MRISQRAQWKAFVVVLAAVALGTLGLMLDPRQTGTYPADPAKFRPRDFVVNADKDVFIVSDIPMPNGQFPVRPIRSSRPAPQVGDITKAQAIIFGSPDWAVLAANLLQYGRAHGSPTTLASAGP